MSFISLSAATSTGAGSELTSDVRPSATVQISITGAPSAVTVTLEGSIDGHNWDIVDTHIMSAGELTALGAIYGVADTPLKYRRLNLTTLTGGTAPTVTGYVQV